MRRTASPASPTLMKYSGVSNYGIHHLKELEASGAPTPAVNQARLVVMLVAPAF